MKWWQESVFYQIYPRSFYDSTGDGVGDLPGIIRKLDYLQNLGIDAIWLSPHYPSPQFDFGYDIMNYTDVHPEYGDLDDFQRFLEGAHRRGMRVILDLVLNHTSHLHPWFLESRASRASAKRDWYVWRSGQDGEPPNNWRSTFGGPAWEYDATTDQYYYHFFFKQQPDLNWNNIAVKEAMFAAVRFWLDRGVDGFRLDAIETLFEDPNMPDHQASLTQEEMYHQTRNIWWGSGQRDARIQKERREMFRHQVRLPRVHEVLQELRSLVDEYGDILLVGETDDLSYCGDGNNELHMVFNFPMLKTPKLTADWLRANQEARLDQLPKGAWPCNTLGNHDISRLKSRLGDGVHDDAIARMSLVLLLTLRGTPFLYYGEEIGMSDYHFRDVRQLRDRVSLWVYEMETEIYHTPENEALERAVQYGRDKCRTPMQWANAPNAGFSPSGAHTWLPVHSDTLRGVNVADERAHAQSMLNFYREALQVRRENARLVSGEYVPLENREPGLFTFLRRTPETGESVLVALNLDQQAHAVQLPDPPTRLVPLLHSGVPPEHGVSETALPPFGYLVAALDPPPGQDPGAG